MFLVQSFPMLRIYTIMHFDLILIDTMTNKNDKVNDNLFKQ